MDLPAQNLKTFRVSEILDYQINFYIVQNLDNSWVPCYQFVPTAENPLLGIVRNKEVLPSIGTVEKVNDLDTVLIYSKDKFSEWEYAAEAAIETVDNFGFLIDDKKHYFDVMFWNEGKTARVSKNASYSGQDFKLEE